jgi:Fur family transcriptional regulator, zinc uptake regulator
MPHDHASQATGTHDHSHDTEAPAPRLTRNQALVLGVLNAAQKPVTAYSILDVLRDDGLRAPLQIYRALEKLIEFGLAHRLESMNAFMPCRQPGCHTLAATAFLICDVCGKVEEKGHHGLTDQLAELARHSQFAVSQASVELRGTCAACAAA